MEMACRRELIPDEPGTPYCFGHVGNGDTTSRQNVTPDRSASAGHKTASGETLCYQWWFRENDDICQLDDEGNTSNGYRITWTP
jgi:hypothetical protein